MKKLLLNFITLTVIASFISCDDYEQFDKEMYKKEIYIISNNENIFDIICDLKDNDIVHNISIGCSGSTPLDKDVAVTLEEDTILLPKYNYSKYELDTTRYANAVPSEYYNFPSLTVTLNRGDNKGYYKVPFEFPIENIEKLSPDSIYFLPISIKSTSEYEKMTNKFNALARIYTKNDYAETKSETTYTVKGFTQNEGEEQKSLNNQKTLIPLSANTVRMYRGIYNPSKNGLTTDMINANAIKITVNSDNTLKLEPYHEGNNAIRIEQLPPPADDPGFLYTNTFEQTQDQYVPDMYSQRFLLYYRYQYMSGGTWSSWIYSKEILTRFVLEEK